MRLPKYRLHKPSGRGVVQWRPYFGKSPHYLPGPFGSTESLEAYERIRARILADAVGTNGRQPDPPPRGRPGRSVKALAIRFLQWAEGYYGTSPSGRKEFLHLKRVCSLAVGQFGSELAADFGPKKLKAVRALMVDLGWSRRFVNHQVNRLRSVFRWAVEEELVDASVLANLRAVKGLAKGRTAAREKPPVECVPWEAIEAVLPHLSPTVATMVRVHWLTGMRSDELTGMRPMEIDRSRTIWVYQPDRHKTAWRGKKKIICIGPQAQALLLPYWPARPHQFIFRPAIAQAELGYPGRKRRVRPRYDSGSYGHAVAYGLAKLARALERDGKLPPYEWHPHQIRHSRSTITRESYGIEGAQAQLGNVLSATEIYAERSVVLAARIAHETG